jgi:CRISPR-associated endonuclease/helicase Cas3
MSQQTALANTTNTAAIPYISVSFPVQGFRLRSDHGYLIYSAITRQLPALHGASWLGIELISGIPWREGIIVLPIRGATLRLRIPADHYGHVLPLAGRRLDINGHTIRLGVPTARPLEPAASLYARCVTIKKFTEPEPFLEAARRQLDTLGIAATQTRRRLLPRRAQSQRRRFAPSPILRPRRSKSNGRRALQSDCSRAEYGGGRTVTMRLPENLLAKSRKVGKEPITLQRHLLETELAAVQVFKLDGRWGRNWCRLFKITERNQQEKFLLHLRLAALFHDIGKANEDFYTAVTSPKFFQQTLRHEHLSALLLHLPEVRNWLRQNKALDLEVITGAVLSHHTKAEEGVGKWRWCQPKTKTTLQLFYSHPEINAVLDRIKEVAALPNQLRLDSGTWADKMPWNGAFADGRKAATDFGRVVKKDIERRALLLAVKAGLIVADAVASGLVREGCSIEDWINERVHSTPTTGDDIARSILDPKANQLSKGKPFDWHSFQKRAATLGNRALLLAACGSGKTIAAWKWAEAQAREHEIGKVIFLYPTRGTATEGFRDYVGFAPEAEAALMHGTAQYELEAIMENPNDATEGKNYETQERLFALGFWSKRYFSATVDQFLGFMEHSYTGLCLLPVLADSALIIDEVHSFDRHMFDNLISFLKTFDVPVLCMTATLPPTRRNELIDAGLRAYPNDAERIELADLKDAEEHPRYQLEFTDNECTALEIAADEYRAGKRVLWVVNTVKRCQRIARMLNSQHSIKPLVYHSRFCLEDRKDRHIETVAAFKQTDKAKIAITTQVCEMSLDLDADVLITEHAPVSSLVQRFGRANRHLIRGKDFRGRLIVYKPENERPYSKDELIAASAFLKDLGTHDVSQKLMADKLKDHALSERVADGSARLLDGGYYATPGMFRDIDEFTCPCILNRQSDMVRMKAYLDNKKPYDALVINVPEKFAKATDDRPAWLPKYLGVADAKFYNAHLGFRTELEETNL